LKELFTGIKRVYDSTSGSTLRGLSNGMFVGRAPGTSGQFVTLTEPAAATDWSITQGLSTSVGGRYEDITVDFHCWTPKRDPEQAYDVADAVRSLYDNKIFGLANSSYTVLHAIRQTPGIPIEEPDDKGWQVVVSYGYRLGRT
jgi:hypothetical protein